MPCPSTTQSSPGPDTTFATLARIEADVHDKISNSVGQLLKHTLPLEPNFPPLITISSPGDADSGITRKILGVTEKLETDWVPLILVGSFVKLK